MAPLQGLFPHSTTATSHIMKESALITPQKTLLEIAYARLPVLLDMKEECAAINAE